MTIAVIRIKGQVKIRKEIVETLNRLNLKRKYTCILVDKNNKEQWGMVEKLRDFVAFGEISKEMQEKLIEKRGKKTKTFFRLHPPRKGIESKKHFGVGKGVLGNNGEKINELIERML